MSKRPCGDVLEAGFRGVKGRFSSDRQQSFRQPAAGPLPGHPLIVLVCRLRRGEGIARDALLGVNGAIPGIAIPRRRSPGGRDPGRGGGLAEVPQDPGDQQPNA